MSRLEVGRLHRPSYSTPLESRSTQTATLVALHRSVPGRMSASAPASDAAHEIAVKVADEIEVAGDRTPEPEPEPEHEPEPGPEPEPEAEAEADKQDQDQNQDQAQEVQRENEQEQEPEHEEADVKDEPEHQLDLDVQVDLEPENPEPAGPESAQHEQPVKPREPQGQTRQDIEESHAESTNQAPANGHPAIPRAGSASAPAQQQDTSSEDHKGHGESSLFIQFFSFPW